MVSSTILTPLQLFFCYASPHHLSLPSFPTRRSSDLGAMPSPLAARAPAPREAAFQPARFSVVVEGSGPDVILIRSEEHTSELQSHVNLVCRLLLEKKK